MNTYITGTTIKKLRETKGITQLQLTEARLSLRGKGHLYIYCNKHGLMKQTI